MNPIYDLIFERELKDDVYVISYNIELLGRVALRIWESIESNDEQIAEIASAASSLRQEIESFFADADAKSSVTIFTEFVDQIANQVTIAAYSTGYNPTDDEIAIRFATMVRNLMTLMVYDYFYHLTDDKEQELS